MKGRNDLVASAAYRPEPAAVAAARKFVRETLQSWLHPGPGPAEDTGLVDDAVLLTSELVTNAVVHAGTDVQVTCKLAGSAVEVVVRDSHPARMVPGPAKYDQIPAERTGGRGLLLPSALASAWGVSYGTDTKAVWFRMGLGGEQAGPAEPGASPDAPQGAVPVTPATTWGVRALPAAAAEPGYDDLLRQCVASARVIVAADAGYALVADEDGNLTVRASAGISPAALLRSAPSVTTVPFMVDGRVTGVLAVAAMLPGRFGDSDVQRLQQLADSMAPILERSRLAELEQARRSRIAVLAEASELLSGPLDPGLVVAAAGRVVVPRLAEWCALLIAGPDGDLRVVAARHAVDASADALTWLLERGCGSVPWPRPQPAGRAGDPWRWPLSRAGPGRRAARRGGTGRPGRLVFPAGQPGRPARAAGPRRPARRAPVPGSAQPGPGSRGPDGAGPGELPAGGPAAGGAAGAADGPGPRRAAPGTGIRAGHGARPALRGRGGRWRLL